MSRTLFIASILSLAGCSAVAGDGVPREGALRLVDDGGDPLDSAPPIRGVTVQDGIRVEVDVMASPASARLTADSNVFDLIEGRVDDEGYLDIRANDRIDAVIAPTVRVTTTELDYIAAREESSGSVTGASGPRFGIAASDGADITVTGSCMELVIVASGGGTTDASGLACSTGEIDAQGGSTVRAQLSSSVTVAASGESEIFVTGSPTDVEERLTDGSTLVVE